MKAPAGTNLLGGGGEAASPGGMSATFKKPKAITCFLCGRGFMKDSMEFHLKQCEKKWLEEAAANGEKKKLPERPE
jgi:hypothetical protein